MRAPRVVAVVLGIALVVGACSDRGSDGAGTTSTSTSTTEALPVGAVPQPVVDPPPDVDDDDLAGLRFTDVTEELGMERDHATRDQIGEDGMTAAASVVDLEGDGDADLFVSRVGDVNSLYRNDGDGTFTDVAQDVGLGGANPSFGTGPAVFFDANGDGRVDVYMAAVGAESDRLYLQGADGRFVDRTQEAGVFQPPPSRLRNGDQVHGLDVADVNGDGNLDLAVVQWDTAVPESAAAAGAQRVATSGDERLDGFGDICASTEEVRAEGFSRVPDAAPNRSRLWLGNGDGTFTDGTARSGIAFDEILGFTPVFGDVDGDGLPDLSITGDACTSRLYRNNGDGTFADITEAAGVGTDENGMGSVLRDLDGDGSLDWFVTSISFPTPTEQCPVLSSINGCSGNRMYLNRGDGTFTDATDDLGLRNGWWGWGAVIEDFSNTGRLEIAQANGYSEIESRNPDSGAWSTDYFKWFQEDPLRFWVPTGDEFQEVATLVGLDELGVGLGLVAFDHDLDGDLDLFVANSEGSPRMYRNDTPTRSWLRVQLEDPTAPGNPDGIGARVEVTVEEGDEPVVGWIHTGGSYESQKLPQLHVGLGDRDEVAEVAVHWPGDDAPQVLTDVRAEQVLTVTRDARG